MGTRWVITLRLPFRKTTLRTVLSLESSDVVLDGVLRAFAVDGVLPTFFRRLPREADAAVPRRAAALRDVGTDPFAAFFSRTGAGFFTDLETGFTAATFFGARLLAGSADAADPEAASDINNAMKDRFRKTFLIIPSPLCSPLRRRQFKQSFKKGKAMKGLE